MTTEEIQKLVRGGTPLATIVQQINKAPKMRAGGAAPAPKPLTGHAAVMAMCQKAAVDPSCRPAQATELASLAIKSMYREGAQRINLKR